MFSEIHQLKQIGLKKAQVARKLEINVKTVSKYWEATPDEFAAMRQKGKKRTKKLAHYRDVILKWLREQPDITCSQILDWIKEHYDDYSVRERTLRRYVNHLRQKYELPKPVLLRQYQAVADLPPGRQIQVDFGQKRVRNSSGGYTTLYVMGTVLAHSRYKYGQWVDKPLTTAMLVQMLKACFEYLGGVPSELVFDQDKLVAVSENYGDIIYTYEFEKFKQTIGFSVYLCRKSDPESKGKVEAVVKYFKNNFATHRLFWNISSWNQSFLDWLKRTGNYNIHGTTKKIPAQVFLEEQQYLRPVPVMTITEEIITRTVRKDNTVLYKGNRYSVPLGTYRPEMVLKVIEQDGAVILKDIDSGQLVAEHRLCAQKGQLIQNNNHLRDHSAKIEELYEQTLALLGATEQTATFLTGIRQEKPRYVRDQFRLLQKLAAEHPQEVINDAIAFCLERRLYGAVDCRDAAVWFNQDSADIQELTDTNIFIDIPDWFKVKAEKRNIATAYAHLTGGEA
jgi:transposase